MGAYRSRDLLSPSWHYLPHAAHMREHVILSVAVVAARRLRSIYLTLLPSSRVTRLRQCARTYARCNSWRMDSICVAYLSLLCDCGPDSRGRIAPVMPGPDRRGRRARHSRCREQTAAPAGGNASLHLTRCCYRRRRAIAALRPALSRARRI